MSTLADDCRDFQILVNGWQRQIDSAYNVNPMDAVRKAVLDAFEAFEPEAIGLEALVFETELSQAEVSNVLIDMAQRHELIVTAEGYLIPDDGADCLSIYIPMSPGTLYGCKCHSVTTYRVNKEWKG